MAKIEVNHRVLRDTATLIKNYCTTQKNQMRSADSAVFSMLSAGWGGQDAVEFTAKWEGINATDSTTVKFQKSLEAYADALTACADAYQKAQEDVYNKANWLPKILT